MNSIDTVFLLPKKALAALMESLKKDRDRLADRVEQLERGAIRSNDAICQILGKALGFPAATEACGDHVAESIAAEAAERITALAARVAELECQPRVVVGDGLAVSGTIEAVSRVQQYILLDSNHPVEKEDVRRQLAKALQKAEARVAELEAANAAMAGALASDPAEVERIAASVVASAGEQ